MLTVERGGGAEASGGRRWWHLVSLDDVGGADAELGGEPRALFDDVRGALELVRAAAQDVGVAFALGVDLVRVVVIVETKANLAQFQ